MYVEWPRVCQVLLAKSLVWKAHGSAHCVPFPTPVDCIENPSASAFIQHVIFFFYSPPTDTFGFTISLEQLMFTGSNRTEFIAANGSGARALASWRGTLFAISWLWEQYDHDFVVISTLGCNDFHLVRERPSDPLVPWLVVFIHLKATCNRLDVFWKGSVTFWFPEESCPEEPVWIGEERMCLDHPNGRGSNWSRMAGWLWGGREWREQHDLWCVPIGGNKDSEIHRDQGIGEQYRGSAGQLRGNKEQFNIPSCPIWQEELFGTDWRNMKLLMASTLSRWPCSFIRWDLKQPQVQHDIFSLPCASILQTFLVHYIAY